MRTRRALLVGPVILALMIGLAPLAVAQTDDAPAPATATGTLEFLEPMGEGEGAGEATTHEEGVEHVHQWTSSDPRLSGTATYTGAWHLYDPPAEDCDDPEAMAGAVYEIVNEGGSWRCAGVRAPIPGPSGATNVHTIVLRGAGGYEGLSTYIIVDWSASPFAFSALITPNSVPLVPVRPG